MKPVTITELGPRAVPRPRRVRVAPWPRPTGATTAPVEAAPRKHDLVDLWSRKMQAELALPAFQRDPALLERILPLMDLLSRYFDGEVRGLDRVPPRALLVGNHSGGTLTPDTTVLIAAWYRARGLDSPLVLLALDALFGIPGFNTLIRGLGLVPASAGNADRALDEGKTLLVYPGGAFEAFRPWRERNRIDFHGRKGFVRLALRRQVPVVPVVSHGGHDTVMVLSRGERLARRLGMERIRVGVYPILLHLPWGVSSAVLPGLPLPAKITTEVCEPLDWTSHGPDAADDPRIVDRCYEEITTRMQATLDRLAAERPHPVLSRLRGLFP